MPNAPIYEGALDGPLSDFEKRLRAAPDFASAVKLARNSYRSQVRHALCPAFWLKQVEDAERVLALLASWPPERIEAELCRLGLPWYAEAFAGDGEAWARELGF